MSDPWIKFYPSDWLAGTRGLTMAEAGLYITLIAMMYERGAPIDMELGRLARLCGAAPAGFKKSLRGLIDQGKITETEQGLWSKRVQNELKKRNQKRDLATRSANARWKKDEQNQTADHTDASKAQCERDATRSQKPDNPHTPKGGERYSDRFQAWWKAYPRKQNASKAKASKSFERLSEVDKQSAEQALPTFRRSVSGTEERFICHPTTWLNERRFETAEGNTSPAEQAEAWAARLRVFASTGRWPDGIGPRPGDPGCKAPADALKAAGYEPGPFAIHEAGRACA